MFLCVPCVSQLDEGHLVVLNESVVREESPFIGELMPGAPSCSFTAVLACSLGCVITAPRCSSRCSRALMAARPVLFAQPSVPDFA